ncbi:hypothetical protein D3C80_773990 [compost metagenome]
MDPDVLLLRAERYEEIEAGKRCRAGARRDDLDVGDRLAGQLQAIQDRGCNDDRGTVLVVMEDRDIHLLAQLALDFETFRRLDVFKVDAAEGGLERGDGRDHLVDADGIDLDIENVDTCKFLEQDSLAFHHRLGCKRADIAETEDCRAVGNDGDEIGARRIIGSGFRIVADCEAGGCNTWRICERQVTLVSERLGCLDFQLARTRMSVEEQRLFVKIRTARWGRL